MSPRPCCSHPNIGVSDPAPGRWSRISECSEIVIGSLCSVVTWQYTVQNKLPRGNEEGLGQPGTKDAADVFILRPSPGLMLVSCLVFGCCVSSFSHRRQSQDPFQIVVYLVLLGSAAMLGFLSQANVHLVLLGYLPWATCAAMAISISGHGAYRRLRPNVSMTQRDEEKPRLAG